MLDQMRREIGEASTALSRYIQEELNQEQREAVLSPCRPILVTACAGSGKTRVITARIAHLIIAHQALPSAIIALTFTNKAASEMRARVQSFLPPQTPVPFIGTFHSYCLTLLKRNSTLLAIPSFSILDEDDRRQLLHTIIQSHGIQKQVNARSIGAFISDIKNQQAITQAPLESHVANPLTRELFLTYEKEKLANRVFDFDDLLIEAYRLFAKDPLFKKNFRDSIQHILVDEYQDTNGIQHALLKQMYPLERDNVSLCAVGDEDQSIYSWRGATIENITNFEKDFPGTRIIKIEQNYRSAQQILDVANAVISNNQQRIQKKIWSGKHASGRVRVLCCISEEQEAGIVVHIARALAQHHKSHSLAVLYRTHAQSRAIEEALICASIAYRIVGGTQFYERKEIRDILAYTRLACNPFDRISFSRAIGVPNRGLGIKFEELFLEEWHVQPMLTFDQLAKHLIENGTIKGVKSDALQAFCKLILSITPMEKPSIAIETILNQTHYIRFIRETEEKEEATARIENIQELITAAKQMEENPHATLMSFLEEIALLQEKSNAKKSDQCVQLMTLHASKGLEFDTVILAGLEEGIFPAQRSQYDQRALEEERRLLYVGITRARERLLLCHARYRRIYGQVLEQTPSRFLDELPEKDIHQESGAYWNNSQCATYATSWFLDIPREISKQSAQSSNALNRQKNFSPSSPSPTSSAKYGNHAAWRVNRIVRHERYGAGTIQAIETKDDATYVTVKFKDKTRKIVSQFLQLS